MDKDKLEKILKYGLMAILLGIGGFAGLFLIKSIVALAITLVGGLVLWYGTPVLAQKLAHWQIMGFQANAAKNPVPELILKRQMDAKRIEDAVKQVTILGAETKQFGSELAGFKKTDPDQAHIFEQTYQNMIKVYNFQVATIQKVQKELVQFDAVIAKSQRIWSMTQASMKANRALKNFQQPDPMEEIRKQTALDSISKSMHLAMTEMEMAVSLNYHSIDDLEKAPQLANDPSEILEANFSIVKENVRA